MILYTNTATTMEKVSELTHDVSNAARHKVDTQNPVALLHRIVNYLQKESSWRRGSLG